MALRLLGHIELPAHRSNGGFDHADIHPPTDRIYVAHTSNDSLDVIDCSLLSRSTSSQRCAQLVRNRPDQGIAQRLSLGANPRVTEGAAKIEMLQHCRRVGQDGTDALSDGIGHLALLLAQIDGQDAEIARLSGNGPNEPYAAFAVLDDTAVAGSLTGFSERLHRPLHRVGYLPLVGQAAPGTPGGAVSNRIVRRPMIEAKCSRIAV